MRISRVFGAGLGEQNMVIEGVAVETETSRRKRPVISEVLVLSVRPKASQAGRSSRCRNRCPGYDGGDGMRRWRTLDIGTTKAYLRAAAARVDCEEHGVVVAHVPWARPGAEHPQEPRRADLRAAHQRRRDRSHQQGPLPGVSAQRATA
ncbi:MAG TPA: transposase family protein [Mycobacterium sp.]|nr:transposase family protein [Mycobacterium sp.]HUH72036.1 transposase family protein [Mycobacterium sp.]